MITTADSGSIDVHMVTHEEMSRGRRRAPRREAALTPGRRLAAGRSPSLGWAH